MITWKCLHLSERKNIFYTRKGWIWDRLMARATILHSTFIIQVHHSSSTGNYRFIILQHDPGFIGVICPNTTTKGHIDETTPTASGFANLIQKPRMQGRCLKIREHRDNPLNLPILATEPGGSVKARIMQSSLRDTVTKQFNSYFSQGPPRALPADITVLSAT